MTKARQDGLYLVLLGAAVFLLVGGALQVASPSSMGDFKGIYFESRCAVRNCDPYDPRQIANFYANEGGQKFSNSAERNLFINVTLGVNLPSTLLLVEPIASLPWKVAKALWTLLTAGSLILALFLLWDIGAESSPVITGALIFVFFATSELFLVLGNPACIVISFVVFAMWCFFRERFAFLGIAALALSILIKPHDVVLVWLYLFVYGGKLRVRALQTLAATVVLGVLSVLWISSVASGWLDELRMNLASMSARGGLNDPGPASMAGHGIGMIVNLQTIFSEWKDDPSFYNWASYILCGILLAVWLCAALKARSSGETIWFGLAPISAIAILPTYHRIYDAKLLVLVIPACVILWKRKGPIAWYALILTGLGALTTGALPWALFFRMMSHLRIFAGSTSHWTLIALQTFTVPMTLLAIGIFYLWIYVRLVWSSKLGVNISDT
jgi:hypothetical protein